MEARVEEYTRCLLQLGVAVTHRSEVEQKPLRFTDSEHNANTRRELKAAQETKGYQGNRHVGNRRGNSCPVATPRATESLHNVPHMLPALTSPGSG